MNSKIRGAGFYILLISILMLVVLVLVRQQVPESIKYSDIVGYFNNEQVESFEINGAELTLLLKDGRIIKHVLANVLFFYTDLGELIMQQQKDGIIGSYDYITQQVPWWVAFLPYLFVFIVLGLLWYFIVYGKQDSANGGSVGGGMPRSMGFGRSRAKFITEDQRKATFEDVAGADEEKEELREIVDFLKNPKDFIEIGARIPKGVLLAGPPGTGKTLLARAVAGEAGVPFLTISGSDFVELYVGVGASRVRDLFEQAKKSSPAIVFIDEIDAVGRQRGAGMTGGHDEREQTLNQLLVEMDGFGANEGVIIIAATNRMDILDPAILRPGRFDRQVYVGLPDIRGRADILKVHSKNKPFDPDVKFESIAKSTAGFTGADLENLLNESALLAARRNKRLISMDEVERSFLKVIMGPEKKSSVISEKEKKLTAYHEAGHAVVTRALPKQDPVHHVSIIPRGRAGGFTMSLPQEDRSYNSREQMIENIVILLGGRMAETLMLDDISTGAHSDIERATKIAKAMVVEYGMSNELGPINYSQPTNIFANQEGYSKWSDETSTKIDAEIRGIIDTAYENCKKLLEDNKDRLVHVAEYLLRNETIDAEVFEKLFDLEEVEDAKPELLIFPQLETKDGDTENAEGVTQDTSDKGDEPLDSDSADPNVLSEDNLSEDNLSEDNLSEDSTAEDNKEES